MQPNNEPIREFHYRVPWHSSSPYPGYHPGSTLGEGAEFQGHRSLLDHPYPRHLDLHASVQDPLGRYLVKTFKQRGRIPVQVLVDISASMRFAGVTAKRSLSSAFLRSAALSASSTGDPFSIFACSDQIHWQHHLPLRWYKLPQLEQIQQLEQQAGGNSVQGLLEVAPYLGRRRSLVFLLSDFHFDIEKIQQLTNSLVQHDVVPVVLWDQAEQLALRDWSWLSLEDLESGQTRSVLMRPALRKQIHAQFEQRRQQLCRLFQRDGRSAFFLEQAFDADAMTRYFYS